jgi:hypothetical protein
MHDSMMLRHHAIAHFSVLAKHDMQEAWDESASDETGSGIDVPDIHSGASSSNISPTPTFFSTTHHISFSYLSSDWLVAYLVATVIFGIGILIGAFTYVSQPRQIASKSPAVVNDNRMSGPETMLVGQITGMVDCKWADPATAPVSKHVAMDQKIALASGLMEITYDSGAKVILQGPVTYVVESSNGGFMSIGKLVGSVTTTDARGFAIRTPNATVTDLGTEFGVEVSKQGDTTSHVFRGSVELRTTSADKTAKSVVRVLHANESARVESNAYDAGGNRIIVSDSSAEPVEFVREIPERTAKTAERSDRMEVIAYWQFDGKNFLADSSGHGHTLVNHGATQIDGTAAFDGRAILSTVDSIDLSPYTRVRVSWSQKATSRKADQVVWAQSENFNVTPGAIAAIQTATGGTASILTATDERSSYNLDEYPVAVDTWENFTVEYNRVTDQGRAAYRADVVKVFKDGTLIGLNTGREGFAPDSFSNASFYIGNAGLNIGARAGVATGAVGFTGQIDNLKIEGTLQSNKNNKRNTNFH